MSAWNVLTIVEGREHVAAAFLHNCGVERYLPTVSVRYRLGPSRRPITAARPIFPGYLFVPAGHDRWGDLHMCPSVKGFLRNGEEPAELSSEAMTEVRRIEVELAMEPMPSSRRGFEIGGTVRYCRRYYPFDGRTGILQRLDKRDRAVIEIMVPGRSVTVVTSAQWLKAVGQ